MPVAWVKTYNGARVFGTTMGHANDFKNEGFRRMVVNACYWAHGHGEQDFAHGQCGSRGRVRSEPDRPQ